MTTVSLPKNQTTSLGQFYQEVLNDPVLQEQLKAATDPESLCQLIMELGATKGHSFTLTFLQGQLNQLSQQLQTLFQKQSKITQQRQLFSSIAFSTRQSPKDEVLFQTAVQGARQILEADRVVIYRFNPDWTGTMVAESIVPGFPKVLNETIGDPCFRQRNAVQYQNGRIRAIDDIYQEPGLTDCHIRLLEQYRVRANLVVPIRKDEQLVGLLIAHQCSGPRSWNKSDIDFLSQLATEVEYGLDYISFINGQQAAVQRA